MPTKNGSSSSTNIVELFIFLGSFANINAKEPAQEIIAYHAPHGVNATLRQFRIGQHTLSRLLGRGQQRQTDAKAMPFLATISDDNAGNLLLDALLSRMENLKAELAEGKAKPENQNRLKETIMTLRQRLARTEEERDHVLKLHNKQVAKSRPEKISLERIKRALE